MLAEIVPVEGFVIEALISFICAIKKYILKINCTRMSFKGEVLIDLLK